MAGTVAGGGESLRLLRRCGYKRRVQTLSQMRRQQPHAVAVFMEAWAHQRLHHAYIISGPAATATTPWVDVLCQCLLCLAATPEGDACGTCAPCRKFVGGNHPDVQDVRPNNKHVLGVDAVRAMTARLHLKATEAAYKLVRLHAVESMNIAAQNALLKTLEEPPGATLFFLMTRQPSALLATVRSRCQWIRLVPATPEARLAQISAAGVSADLAPLLADVLGDDLPALESFQQAGAEQVWQTLRTVLQAHVSPHDIFAVAADLGSQRERYDIALALLEVVVRNTLASRHGATTAIPLACEVAAPCPAAAASYLVRLRRQKALHVNRAMALEGILMGLHGMAA